MAGQVDQAGRTAFGHAFRVAEQVKTEHQKVIAYLHDVVEDTAVTLADLRHLRFTELTVVAVDLLTRRSNDTYFGYVGRITGSYNVDAVTVKLADVDDHLKNTDAISDELVARYRRARGILSQALCVS